MAWYDEYIDKASESLGSMAGDALDGASDWFGNKVAERTGSEPQVVAGAGIPINSATTSGAGLNAGIAGMSWTMIGGIVGVLSLLYMVLKK